MLICAHPLCYSPTELYLKELQETDDEEDLPGAVGECFPLSADYCGVTFGLQLLPRTPSNLDCQRRHRGVYLKYHYKDIWIGPSGATQQVRLRLDGSVLRFGFPQLLSM